MHVSIRVDVLFTRSIKQFAMFSRCGRGCGRSCDSGGGRDSYGGGQSGSGKRPCQCKHCGRNNHISEKCWEKFGCPAWYRWLMLILLLLMILLLFPRPLPLVLLVPILFRYHMPNMTGCVSSSSLRTATPQLVHPLQGEEYKLFWPAQPEFVRMAAKFGAKIVPFASIGEDDLGELVLDYEDLMSIPFVREKILEGNRDIKLRNDEFGDRDQDLLIPILCPKIPGRYYYLFGKPISMSGKVEVLKERETANALYRHVKSEVESMISYLLKKREEDAYRSIFHRGLYRAISGSSCQVPSFDP